jgi:hypothetical protein
MVFHRLLQGPRARILLLTLNGKPRHRALGSLHVGAPRQAVELAGREAADRLGRERWKCSATSCPTATS